MSKKILRVIRVFIGISIAMIILHYVYAITSLTKEEISIPSLTKEELKRTNIIKQGETFRLEGFTVTFVSVESANDKLKLELDMNQKKKFIKIFKDYYSVYALKDDKVDFDISNYIENDTISLPITDYSNFNQLIIVKNVDNKPIVKLSIK